MPDHIPNLFKEFWSQIVLAAGLIFNYGKQSQHNKRMKEDIAKHLDRHNREEFLTLPAHDRLQEMCKNEWKSEFRHIRNEMSTEFGHVKEALTDLKKDIRNNNNNK